ncbi:MAG: CAAD domain-containing protein [Leptolyngbyaceae bacterium]|nr:CAAD domain-containing protein [Leptolyngbyaceae bacterium]
MASEINKDPNISGSNDASESSSGAITTLSSTTTEEPTDKWTYNPQKLNTFIQEFPSFLEEFWGKYRLPILALGVVLGFIIFAKILLAILEAINDLPFLEPFFEIIGISYFSWFLIRYLLPSTGREELGGTLKALTDRVKGGA